MNSISRSLCEMNGVGVEGNVNHPRSMNGSQHMNSPNPSMDVQGASQQPNYSSVQQKRPIRIVGRVPLPKQKSDELTKCQDVQPTQAADFSKKKDIAPITNQSQPKAWSASEDLRFCQNFHKEQQVKSYKNTPIPIISHRTETLQPKLIGRSETACSVCEEKIYSSDITTIEGCFHTLHVDCLLPYLQLKINEGHTNITCPFGQCGTLINERFLRKTLNKEDMDKYYRFSAYSFMERMKNWIPCSEPNCKELFALIPIAGKKHPHEQVNLLKCSSTGKKRCALCLEDYHPQFDSCEEFRDSRDPNVRVQLIQSNEAKLLEMVANKQWKQCPKCKLYVEKNEGCNHIHCRCGKHFCYVCRGPYPNCNCPGARENMNRIPAHLQ